MENAKSYLISVAVVTMMLLLADLLIGMFLVPISETVVNKLVDYVPQGGEPATGRTNTSGILR